MNKARLFLAYIFCVLALTAHAQSRAYRGAPSPEDAVIYEVNVPDFSKQGNLRGVIRGLDAINDMGANVIYLMPIYPIGNVKSFGSPYCVKDYTAVNSSLGTMADLRELVSAAHQKNMAVMLDWVGNHTAFDNPWTANRDWYLRDGAGNAVSPPGKGWSDVAQLNYNNPDMRTAMIRAMQYWVVNAGVDGFRCDYADGPPVDFWEKAIAATRKVSKGRMLFLAESGTQKLYSAGFDILSGFDFYNTLKQVYKEGRSVKLMDDLMQRENVNAKPITRYITNHDLVGPDGPPNKAFDNEQGALAAFVVASTTQKVPMLFYGEGNASANNRLTANLNSPALADNNYRQLLNFRNNNNVLKSGRGSFYSSDDVFVYKAQLGAQSVLVICNQRNREINYRVPSALSGAKWTDAFTANNKTLNVQVHLQPFQYLILKGD